MSAAQVSGLGAETGCPPLYFVGGFRFDTLFFSAILKRNLMTQKDFQKIVHNLPDNPGVYFFKKGREILYVGKATSLRDRVRSYFSRDLMGTRGPLLVKMVNEAEKIDFTPTDSVLEALILEAYTIKENQPPYNSKEKDDKSYNYVVITDEAFPRILTLRGRNLQKTNTYKVKATFGPFPHGTQLRDALKIVRKIFPYRDRCSPAENFSRGKILAGKPCFNRQIGLCPGVCTGEIDAKQYAKTIRNIKLFFSGKKAQILKNLEKDMKGYAKKRLFEKAESTKRMIFALNHIQDVSLIRSDALQDKLVFKTDTSFRMEAYDIAHISGTSTVGVMVVMENGELEKDEYRKFKIRGGGEVTVDDTKNLRELLTRRLGHAEWQLPNLIVIDGGVAQMNLAKEVLKERGFNIEIVSVVKDDKHKAREVIGKKGAIQKYEKNILLINAEAHRFAIAYHRNLRGKSFRGLR